MRRLSLSAFVLTISGVVLSGCSQPLGGEDLTSADESVGTSEDAITGDMKVGETLRTTTALNLRAGAGTTFEILLTMPAGASVTVTQAAPVNGFYAVKYAEREGWASGTYLEATAEPANPDAPAPGGPVKPIKITGPAVRPHVQGFANAACAAVSGCPYTVGTRVGHDPSADRAIDMMMSPGGVHPSDGGVRGTKVADFGIAKGSAHKVDYVIWKQRINSLDGRGWRMMADRGSITQNHYDHVHVSFAP